MRSNSLVDWAILPFLSLLYLLCSLDKANAGNAKLFGVRLLALGYI